MVVMVCAFNDDTPSRHATNAASERHPVAPHRCSPPISATISTMRPSMALRCPANSANSSNNTSSRSLTVSTGVSNDADQDITRYWHAGTTNFDPKVALPWDLSLSATKSPRAGHQHGRTLARHAEVDKDAEERNSAGVWWRTPRGIRRRCSAREIRLRTG